MLKQNLQHHYDFSLQCQMNPQKSFIYDDLLLTILIILMISLLHKKYFLFKKN